MGIIDLMQLRDSLAAASEGEASSTPP
jgi:hypothetical protein